MSLIILPLATGDINQSTTDSVTFLGVGTLNIAGTAQNTINVSLGSVGGAGLLDTINISYANVTLGGLPGVTALATYNLGTGATLNLTSTLGVSAGTTINFSAPNSHLKLGNGVNLSLLGGISGFGPGSNIDLSNVGFSSYTYTDKPGIGDGGTLTLVDANGNSTSVVLTTGNFTAASFNVHSDGSGGTMVDFATYVSGITATPATADLTAGGSVVLQLATTAPVTITGTPTLTLNDGGTATFDAAHSSSTNLVFNYTVQAGQNTPDLAVTAVNMNGGSAKDVLGNDVSLNGAVANPAGTLQIDTTAPTITAIATTPSNGSLAVGQVVTVNLTPSEAVTVAGGIPTLTLNNGGTATFDAAHSTPTNLAFTYTVQPNQNTSDLTITGSSLNGASITDGAGNPANLAGAVGNPPGTLQTDTVAPTITGISTNPASGSFGAGQVVAINLTPSEAVTITGGPPTLTLNDGRTATYDAVQSTATNLVFNYTVQAGDNTPDLAIVAASLNGATMTDAAGNAGTLAGGSGNPAGVLRIDTIAPTIIALSTAPNSGALAAGQVVTINLTPSEAVAVTGGTPTLTLDDGGTATYDAVRSTATNLVFNYTVAAGQNTADLNVTLANLNGAAITDGAGNPISLASAAGNPAGILQIDTTAPTITAIATLPSSGTLSVGQVVAINLTPSEAVAVTGGTPTLTLNDGGIAIYDPTQSTSTGLVFNYTVVAGQNVNDLAVTGVNMNGATIADPAGNAANLAGAVGNPPGILGIDTAAPTITGLATNPPSGALRAGQVVAFTLTPSEAVTVSGGIPTLTLNDGRAASYDAAHSSTTSLVFNYTVQPGDNTADLAVTNANLNGATIIDAAGNAANLAGAVGNPAGILQIDTTAPTITSVAMNPSSGSLAAGQVVSITVIPSEAVTVVGGTPTLTLSDGQAASYDPNSSTATSLVFKYVVQPGDIAADLTITGYNLNGATIADPAGNAANLAGVIGNPPGVLQIDTTKPPVTSVYDVVTTPGNGDLGVGSVVTLRVVLTGNATVAGGTPTLILSDGGTATYDPSSSTLTSLAFQHTVAVGQNTPDLTVTAIALNGATVLDSVGAPVDLSGAVVNPGGLLQIDTTTPTISTVTIAPGNGAFGAGQIITINVATSEAVSVAGGTPTLTLNDGGVATYNAANSTGSNLVFTYTVLPGQNTPDLALTASSLNGAIIADGAGNVLDLTPALVNPAGTLQIDTTAPTVIAVTTQPASGTLTIGQVVSINVTPSEAVIVSGGTPTLTLDDGGIAIYDPASSTPTNLVFKHTVQVGQNSADLSITGFNLNGAAIADPAGNAIVLSGVIGNPAGILQVNTAPTVTSVTVNPPNADLTIGANIALTVNFSGPVTVAGGTPKLTLSDGGTATYDAASSTPTSLVFRNTVQAGENTPDLSVSAALLNNAVITDSYGSIVDLSGAVGNPAGTLQVDTTAPMMVSIVMGGSLEPGKVFTITANISEPVTVVGGPFMYQLANGGLATYNPSLSTPTMLVSTYTVPISANGSEPTTNDVGIVGYVLNGASATDGAGNVLDVPSVTSAIAAAQGNFANVSMGTKPTTIDVYRFFDSTTGTHFYTQDQNERQTVLATRPDLVPEGPGGVGLTAINPASQDANAVPVYRFFDSTHGTQFLTASITERDTVIATRSDLTYEPASVFYEHVVPQAGDTAVYRYFDSKFGTHFYTDNAAERAAIAQTRPDLIAEGIGFYEPARNPAT